MLLNCCIFQACAGIAMVDIPVIIREHLNYGEIPCIIPPSQQPTMLVGLLDCTAWAKCAPQAHQKQLGNELVDLR